MNDKKSLVDKVFSSVAKKYDIMNDIMSFGIHRLWKKRMMEEIEIIPNGRYLDLATGSGDIVINILKKAKHTPIEVIASDINNNMLAMARGKFIDSNLINNIEFVLANGENLPFADNTLDSITIAFGIRNFSNIELALSEIYRTLKKGGRFLCLEFSPKVRYDIVQKIYDLYSFNCIPKIGKIVVGESESYEYLVKSIREFPETTSFLKMMKKAGFTFADYDPLSLGVTNLFVGR